MGRRLGPAEPKSGSLDSRVRAAAALLSSLGSELDVVRTPDGFEIRGYACPLAAVVPDQPNACHARSRRFRTARVVVRSLSTVSRSSPDGPLPIATRSAMP